MREISSEVLTTLLKSLNPHWETGKIDPDIQAFRRRKYFDLFFPLVQEIAGRRAVVLMGPRRVGKTVMLWQTIQRVIEKGGDPTQIVYLPLDTPLLQGQPLDALVNLFLETSKFTTLDHCTVIFDEIQYLENWSNHLKVLVDRFRQTTFIASGSAAAALRMKSIESGAGRFTDFTLPPLTFYEFLDLQEKIPFLFKAAEEGAFPMPTDISALNQEFINYINYGGYPESTLNPEIRENPGRFIRSDIIEKVLLRDLPSLYGIADIQELTRLFNVLAFQTGNEVTYEGLCRASGISKNALKKYIEYLEAAFLIKTVKRVDNSGKTFKRINYFKVYLTNPSMYAALFGLIAGEGAEAGFLVETAIFCQVIHDPSALTNLYYARWAGGRFQGEVDFVFLDRKYRVDWCAEIKWSDRFVEKPSELRSLTHFLQQCGLERGYVTTRSQTAAVRQRARTLVFTPAAWVAFEWGRFSFEGRGVEMSRTLQALFDPQLSLPMV